MKFKREKTITYNSSQIGLKLACHTGIAHFWFSSITITNRLYLDGSLSLLVPLKNQRKVKKKWTRSLPCNAETVLHKCTSLFYLYDLVWQKKIII